MTLIQFQAWLEGVEEMHSEDWCPTADQWNLIRNKIKTIIIENVVKVPTDLPIVNSSTVNQPSLQGFRPAPEIPSSIPSGPVEEVSPEAQSLLSENSEGKHTTPNSEHGDASPFS